ncbi:GlcG/HbpS family heme-binding protein [Candidatus Reidiella endopervernicosa]|uniref:Heme-binding protein n=1 Tax=Candidatus Reidiella endopervernicosa TaxID=2738883 RepID=A0A6N0HUT0_9GAMM|nr:heme-binding protein [Candidatus Reidiella endopervernicosa]QKQ25926.1 heme-binding protein [Candidatus Reidiella endopervernicosa]
MKFVPALSLLVAASLPFTAMAESESPMAVNIKRLSMESALTVAKAAVEACRKEGIQIGVTVVDRGGNPQVVLRDVLAPDLTLNISKQKAYTAISR